MAFYHLNYFNEMQLLNVELNKKLKLCKYIIYFLFYFLILYGSMFFIQRLLLTEVLL